MRSEPRSPEQLAKANEILKSLPEDLDGLVAKLGDADPDVRRLAAVRLGGLEDARAVGPLLQVLEDEVADVRSSAALALALTRSADAAPALARRLADDSSPGVRAMSVWALGMLEATDVAGIMTQAMSDPDEHVRHAACWFFAHSGDLTALPRILALLEDPVWFVRKGACQVLIKLDIGDQRVVDTLEALRREPEGEEYEKWVLEFRAYRDSDEYRQIMAEIESADEALEPEEADEDEEDWELPEEPSLAELLEQARELLNRKGGA